MKAYNLFLNINEVDVILFNMNSKISNPIDLLVTHVVVPPS